MAKWFYLIDSQQYEPVDSAVLKQLANSGHLTPNDKVRRESMVEWHSASEVKGLFAANQSVPHEPVVAVPSEVSKAAVSKEKSSDYISDAAQALSAINRI